MNGHARSCCCLRHSALSILSNQFQQLSRFGRLLPGVKERRERSQRFLNVPNQLNRRSVVILDIRWNYIDVNDWTLVAPVPKGRPILDWYVADRYHDIARIEQFVRSLIR